MTGVPLSITPRQTINWETIISTSFGIFFSLVLGFFVLQLVLAGIGLATDFGNAKAMKAAKATFESAIKGLVVSLGAWIVLNSILGALGVNFSITNPAATLAAKFKQLENCLRNYASCTE